MRLHSHHMPTILSVGSSVVGFVSEVSNEAGSHLGGLVAVGGLLFAIFSHFSDKKRVEALNQQLRIELAAERATGAQKDHRIAFLEAKLPVPLAAPATPEASQP